MIEHELQPWLVITSTTGAAQTSPALWRIAETQAPALILFSEERRAHAYAHDWVAGHTESECVVRQPTQLELLAIMIECYRQSIHWAVLDPDEQQARRVFDLREVLKAARSQGLGK